ncbi:MAG: hypothetical protein AAGA65_29320 [Actinomycetota bacterium]
MWEIIYGAAAGLGGLAAWKALDHRNLDRTPPGVEEGTPVKEWPESLQREAVNYQITRHWKASFAGGLSLFAIGLAGLFVLNLNEIRTAESPTPEDIIDVLATDPQTTYSREEAACAFDAMTEAGVDFNELAELPEEEAFKAIAAATGQMTQSEVTQMEACFDAETQTHLRSTVDSMSDEQLRELLISAFVADPNAGLSRSEAECLLDALDDKGLVRDLATSGDQISPEVETALVDAETVCL